MRFQGDKMLSLLVFCSILLQQKVGVFDWRVQFPGDSFEKPATVKSTTDTNTNVKSGTISFLICIALVLR